MSLIYEEHPKVFFAEHAIDQVGSLVGSMRAVRVLAIVDQAAANASGAGAALQPALASFEVTWFTGFDINPQLHDVERGVKVFREFQPDLIIAIGGGTAIDLGKLIGSIATEPASAHDIVTGKSGITCPGPPLIAIPTTAGTGSEATQFAVAYASKSKYSVSHRFLMPTCAIIDPVLTYSLPPEITASTGLDAFCQAIESIWAVGATDESIEYAKQAAALSLEHLMDAVCCPTVESRAGMSHASHLAGKAINISKTTASHAISYAFTSIHNIPHGKAVALTLSRMLSYNAGVRDDDCLDPRGAANVLQRIDEILDLLGASSLPDACNRIDSFVRAIGCPCSPAEAGVTDPNELRKIVSSVNTQRMSNNPRTADDATLLRLLMETPVLIERSGLERVL